MKHIAYLTAALLASSTIANADEITDTLQSAIDAYEEGDIQYALEELTYAQQLMNELKAGELNSFLPDAPDGWSREISDDLGMAAMFGGGTIAQADYTNGSGETVQLMIIVDSPMVAAMSNIFANAAILASQGRLVRVGREKFLEQDGELTGLLDGRVMIKAEGASTETMLPILEAIDLRALGRFGL